MLLGILHILKGIIIVRVGIGMLKQNLFIFYLLVAQKKLLFSLKQVAAERQNINDDEGCGALLQLFIHIIQHILTYTRSVYTKHVKLHGYFLPHSLPKNKCQNSDAMFPTPFPSSTISPFLPSQYKPNSPQQTPSYTPSFVYST